MGDNEEFVRGFFRRNEARSRALAAVFVGDVDEVMEDAAAHFERMLPGMAYVDAPRKALARDLFGCSVLLALYLALSERGVDVHDFGRQVIEGMSAGGPAPAVNAPARDTRSPVERFREFIAAGEASREEAKPGEFVFEAFFGDGEETDWGMTVQSCAICHAFGKHDAMELVPYMCATDDVMSDRQGQGLRRTGTLALGVQSCDFRYKPGGEPKHIAVLHPTRIRLKSRARVELAATPSRARPHR